MECQSRDASIYNKPSQELYLIPHRHIMIVRICQWLLPLCYAQPSTFDLGRSNVNGDIIGEGHMKIAVQGLGWLLKLLPECEIKDYKFQSRPAVTSSFSPGYLTYVFNVFWPVSKSQRPSFPSQDIWLQLPIFSRTIYRVKICSDSVVQPAWDSS